MADKDIQAKKPVVSEVTARIKEMLFSGELTKGQKLPSENKLAETLGVGRSSVREALMQLSASGYVELVPNRGAFAIVTDPAEIPSPHDGALHWLTVNRASVDDLLKTRACIEPFAAELCAERADKALVDSLAENLAAFEKELKKGRHEELSKLDYTYHKTILEGSGNRFLIGMYSQLLQLFMQYSSSSFQTTDVKRNTLTEHRMIFDAIAAHSPVEAGNAMRLHLSIAMRRLNSLDPDNAQA